jgi:hypothetical protein
MNVAKTFENHLMGIAVSSTGLINGLAATGTSGNFNASIYAGEETATSIILTNGATGCNPL